MSIAEGPEMSAQTNWDAFYRKRGETSFGRYPTEWVVRTLAGGNYPTLHLDRTRYPGARILDMGCGDGRNLPLLLELGFEVHATEISSTIVDDLKTLARRLDWPVQFAVGTNSALPYPDRHFDYMLCCSSGYYLDSDTTWTGVRNELARVMKKGGLLIANFPDEENAVLSKSVRQPDGSLLITADPFGLRNGIRFMTARNATDIVAMLAPDYQITAVGHQNDDFYGLRVSGYLVVAQRA